MSQSAEIARALPMWLAFALARFVQSILIAIVLLKIASVGKICASGKQWIESENTTRLETICLEIPNKYVHGYVEISRDRVNTTEAKEDWENAMFNAHIAYNYFALASRVIALETVVTLAFAVWMKFQPVWKDAHINLGIAILLFNGIVGLFACCLSIVLLYARPSACEFSKLLDSESFEILTVHSPNAWATACMVSLLAAAVDLIALYTTLFYVGKEVQTYIHTHPLPVRVVERNGLMTPE